MPERKALPAKGAPHERAARAEEGRAKGDKRADPGASAAARKRGRGDKDEGRTGDKAARREGRDAPARGAACCEGVARV